LFSPDDGADLKEALRESLRRFSAKKIKKTMPKDDRSDYSLKKINFDLTKPLEGAIFAFRIPNTLMKIMF
jgi:hypothetical protein